MSAFQNLQTKFDFEEVTSGSRKKKKKNLIWCHDSAIPAIEAVDMDATVIDTYHQLDGGVPDSVTAVKTLFNNNN